MTQDEGKIEIQMVCNCLFPMDDVRKDTTNLVIRTVTKGVGNWVGGTLRVYGSAMTFSINKLNAAFQTRTAPLLMPYEDIRSVRIGRMMWLFKTVDIEMVGGIVRIRGWGAKNNELCDYLCAKISDGPPSQA